MILFLTSILPKHSEGHYGICKNTEHTTHFEKENISINTKSYKLIIKNHNFIIGSKAIVVADTLMS